MKKILIFLIPILIIGGGTAIALTMQDDPICTQDGHTGYEYDPIAGGTPLPPLPFNPSAPMPAGLTDVGQFGNTRDFTCDREQEELCHWAYLPSKDGNPAKWVKCDGQRVSNN